MDKQTKVQHLINYVQNTKKYTIIHCVSELLFVHVLLLPESQICSTPAISNMKTCSTFSFQSCTEILHKYATLHNDHRMRFTLANGLEATFCVGFAAPGVPNTFQNRNLSSPAAEATVHPSGLWAMKRTLDLCPVSSAIFTIEGYFHKVNWYCINPCELSNSRSLLLHNKEQTWEPVSTEFKQAPVREFQNLMHRSFNPPPEASKLL